MKNILIVAVLATGVFGSGCASTILINSSPPGADVYVDGMHLGRAPVTYTDTAIVGSTHQVELRLEGYETRAGMFARNAQFNAGACLGGVFLLFPFLWILDYPGTALYSLEPLRADAAVLKGVAAILREEPAPEGPRG